MTQRDYEIYNMYLSFEKDMNTIENEIKDIPLQTARGHSKIGYMTDELRNLRGDLLKVVAKYKQDINNKKEKL